MVACALGNIRIVKHVFDKICIDINALDDSGNSAFLYSLARSNNLEVIKFLIDKGANYLETTRDYSLTALHIACRDKDYKLLEYLLNETPFAQMDLKNLSHKGSGLIQFTLRYQSPQDTFKMLDFLLKRGVDINERDKDDLEPFAYAHKCSEEVISYLLVHGADVNSVDQNGMNCLQKIVNLRNRMVEERLLGIFINHGINLNSQDNKGMTLMHLICFSIDEIPIEFLLDAGARTDIPNNDGEYPFDIAFSLNPFDKIVKILEKRGLNYSKYIPDEVRSQQCDQCKNISPSLKGRCGHHLHLNCLKDMKKCPICDTRVTVSNKTEKLIKSSNFDDLVMLSDSDLFVLLDNFIEDESIIDFDAITSELKRRKDLNANFQLSKCKYPDDLFSKACGYGRLRLIQFCDVFDISGESHDGGTKELSFAIVSRNIELIEYVIDKFGSTWINQMIGEHHFPIHLTCFYKNLEIFDLLVKKGANIETEHDEINIFHLACSVGAVEIVKRLIEDYDYDPNLQDEENMTPLHYNILDPISDLKEEVFAEIAELIKLPEKTDEEYIEIAKFLLDHGAKIDAVDASGETLIELTGVHNREKIFDLFIDYSRNVLNNPIKLKKQKVLISIAKCGKNLSFLERIIEMGAKVNWADRQGYTALMAACRSGNYEMCSRLIELGANVFDLDNEKNFSPFLHACGSGKDNVKILELLIENGADIHQRTFDGMNALHVATESISLNSVKKLLSLGFDPNSRDLYDQTPFHYAVKVFSNGILEILPIWKALIDAGADLQEFGVDVGE